MPTVFGASVGLFVLGVFHRLGWTARVTCGKRNRARPLLRSAGLHPEGSPLGEELLVAHQLVAGELVGLEAVAIAQILEPKLHGGEHGVVVVHRSTAYI